MENSSMENTKNSHGGDVEIDIQNDGIDGNNVENIEHIKHDHSENNVETPGNKKSSRKMPRKYNALAFLQPQKKQWKAWIIPCFVIINVITLLVSMAINNCPRNSRHCFLRFMGRFSFQPLKENPMIGPSSQTLIKMGGLSWVYVVEKHQAWRFVSSMFIHAGVVHLLLNMLGLYPIGIFFEQEFGFFKVGLLYILSGVGGAIASGLFFQTGVAVGASGAIFGLVGAMLSEYLTNWTVYKNKVKATVGLAIFTFINLALGVLPPRVNNFDHIGGFISGFLLGFVLLMRPQFGWVDKKKVSLEEHQDLSVKSKHKPYQYIYSIIALVLLITGFTVGLILLFRGVSLNDNCAWCRYLSCVPVGKFDCNNYKTYHCVTSQIGGQLTLNCQNVARSLTLPMSGNYSNGTLRELCRSTCQ